jgi:hypothetical protein
MLWVLFVIVVVGLGLYGFIVATDDPRHLDSLADPDNPVWDRDWPAPPAAHDTTARDTDGDT